MYREINTNLLLIISYIAALIIGAAAGIFVYKRYFADATDIAVKRLKQGEMLIETRKEPFVVHADTLKATLKPVIVYAEKGKDTVIKIITEHDTVEKVVRPFVASADTVSGKYDISVKYAYPMNEFLFDINKLPDTLFTESKIIYVPQEERWYNETWFKVVSYTAAFAAGTYTGIQIVKAVNN